MPSEEKLSEIEIISLEQGSNENLFKVNYKSKNFPYSFFEINKKDKEKLNYFLPGKKYSALFEVSGKPDFLGQKNSWENVSTVSYILKGIYKDEKIIYKLI